MAENIKGKQVLRNQVALAVKQAMIDTKYTDEVVSFG